MQRQALVWRHEKSTRRVQRVRLFLCSFVLYMSWIPSEHCQGTSAVECVTAHLRGFEEVSEIRSQPDDFKGYGCFYALLYCTGRGFQANIVEEYVPLSASQDIFAGLKRTRDQKLSSRLMSGQLSSAITVHWFDVAHVLDRTPSSSAS